jgi:hypothetical protein
MLSLKKWDNPKQWIIPLLFPCSTKPSSFDRLRTAPRASICLTRATRQPSASSTGSTKASRSGAGHLRKHARHTRSRRRSGAEPFPYRRSSCSLTDQPELATRWHPEDPQRHHTGTEMRATHLRRETRHQGEGTRDLVRRQPDHEPRRAFTSTHGSCASGSSRTCAAGPC